MSLPPPAPVGRRPTRQALALAGIGAVLVAVGATAQAGWLFVLAAGVLGALVASVPLTVRWDACVATHVLPPRARAGDDVVVRIEVTNRHGRKSLSPLRIEDHHPALEPAALFCDRLEPGGRAVAEQVRRATRRGEFPSAELRLCSLWPFGIVAARRCIEVPSPILVVPRWVALEGFPLGPAAGTTIDASRHTGRIGPGEMFAGIREYRPGDDVRRLHWRSSARRGELVVREHAESARHRVVVVLAGGEVGSAADSVFECLVSAAASVALAAVDLGHPVELVRSSPQGVAERSAGGRRELLGWLAAAQAIDAPLNQLAAAPRASTVVLCVPSHGRAGASLAAARRSVQRAGARAVVIVADSSTWQEGLAAPSQLRPGDRVLRRGESLRACLQG